jgi:iron complex outermembrane receptor protein
MNKRIFRTIRLANRAESMNAYALINTKAHALRRKPLSSAISAAILLSALGQPAFAADSTKPNQEYALNTVTVTATRREESLQEIPIAVSVIDGAQLEQDNRNNVSSIIQQVPTLNFRTGASNKDTSLFVRGVGTISTSPGVEPTVATVVDGVFYGRPGQSTLDLLDLQRIEILRGPQGTLFGKNASAGVLNVVSKATPEETSGYIDYSHFGKGNENRLRAGIGGRLSENVKGSVSALFGKYDGNVKNVKDSDDVNGYDRKGLRGKLEIEPGDDVKVTLIGDYSKADDNPPSGVIISSSPAFAAALNPVNAHAKNQKINSDYDTHVEDTNKGLSGQIDWKVGEFDLTSITAWRSWDNTQYQDGDRLADVYAQFARSHDKGEVDYNQYSQEFRLASPTGQFVDYVVGAFYLHNKSEETYQRFVTRCGADGSTIVPGLNNCAQNVALRYDQGRADYSVTGDSFALFGESIWNFTDDFRGIAGLRWTHDDLEYDHRRVSTSAVSVTGIQPATSSEGSVDEDGWTARAGLQYDLTDSVTSYVTYSRGYKGPAYNAFFNMQPRDTEALAPETSNSYEIGLKSTAFDNRLTANIAAFHTEYDDYQANFYDTVANQVVTRLINAGSVKTEGVELDASLQATDQLKFSASVAYTKARVDHFNCPVGAAATCDIDGKPLPFTPDWKSYVRADYRIPLSNGLNIELSTDYSWQDDVQYSLDQNVDTIQESFGIWNASVALVDDTNGWRVAVIGKNLNDKSYAPLIATGSGYVYRLVPRDDERYYGIQLRKDF